ncbi:MAG: DUF5107 domain-containing protein [Clostridium sp.]|nr:DUF5107 domain-containing protein [Clostridium sp.]
MMETRVWSEKIKIPTYEIGEAEKNPIFLDKRVYQGSSGKVYPYATIEKISDVKVDKEYEAVYLENEYIKVMILPELGGRIQRAYDKTNNYDFVYYNHVIKPALVGLLGPWISGGIEFNWPQHHRPTTFLPVDYMLMNNEDGSKSVLVNDVDQIYGTKGIAKFTLYPGKSYIEIEGQLYNRTSTPQTFLWWANPAVAVNENTQSIFPPDVHAVMDHGKRDVSRFPIATGVYYKKDYSEGVDISRYKNIPVPTSYMAAKSKYDFVGGYDYGKEAGILHVADHHISPGKKQWTWGCGDFGKAWDRNLTDDDGPYVELMTGVYTDNQPDFTWIKPFEEKTFKQYFMPYKAVGQVKNATKEAALNLEYDGENINVIVYATEIYENAKIVLEYNGEKVFEETTKISPTDIFKKEINKKGIKKENLKLTVYDGERKILSYQPEEAKIEKMPEPAKAALEPEEIMNNEELYLTGLHIEQYRHATYLPDPYYLEGLKRDPGDIRINNAYGSLLMRRGNFEEGEKHFRKALERLTGHNPNPYNSETYYLLGLVLLYQGKEDESYDAFFKATWTNEQQEMSFYYLAAIDAKKERWIKSLEHVEKALVKNMHNIKARGLKSYILRKLGRREEALRFTEENLALDPFDFVSCNELIILQGNDLEARAELNKKMRNYQENYLMTARDYAEAGAYKEAIDILRECTKDYPMLKYYEAYYMAEIGKDYKESLDDAESYSTDYCLPNKLEDIAVLRFAIENGCDKNAPYYLGNLFYDKMQWKEAVSLWNKSAKSNDSFPTVHRNLALAYYNKIGDKERARIEMEKAFFLNRSDARIFLELDQLYKKLNMTFEERLANYEKNIEIIDQRDDLYIEYITLVNMCGNHEKAYDCIMNHKFHAWEGGEGKAAAQYILALMEIAKKEIAREHYRDAEELLRKALVYPYNLGEGKLEGTKDNNIYYYLGITLEAQGKAEEAEKCFAKATIGTDEPAGVMYYNDQPADMILYQGLAYMKLGKNKEAKSRFYRLIDYGEQHLDDKVKIDYFAVSLPDFLIFNEDYTLRNHVHCIYLMALGNIGLGNIEKARKFLNEAEKLEPCHMMCRVYKNIIE